MKNSDPGIHPGIRTISAHFGPKKEVIAVYLFGSYAKGRQRPDSDIDLGLLLDIGHRDVIADKIQSYHNALARKLRKDLHLIALNTASPLLLKQVLSKGRCILINDSRKHALFKMNTLVKIMDFGFYKANLEREFARRLVQI